MAPFLAMAELKQALFLLIWLNEKVQFFSSFLKCYLILSVNHSRCVLGCETAEGLGSGAVVY